jgi:Transcriptional regulator, AbiEi antitoxin
MTDGARHAITAIAARQHHVLTRRQAAEAGFDRRRIATAVRHGWLAEPIPGVLVLTDAPASWHGRLMAVVLASGSHGVASHRSAARLHRLDGFDGPGNAVVEVSVSRRYRLDPAVAAVTHHVTPLADIDVAVVDGIPCTTLARTLVDLGSVVRSRLAVRRALTSARRRGIDLFVVRAAAERLHRPGQRGTGTMLSLLDQVPWEGRLPDSWFEELLALALADPHLPEVVPQCAIRDEHGVVVARTDIGIPSVRLGLEAHSRRFHFGPDAAQRDEDRDLIAARCGWELIYLGWHAAKQPAAVLALVRDVVRRRAVDLRRSDSAEV